MSLGPTQADSPQSQFIYYRKEHAITEELIPLAQKSVMAADRIKCEDQIAEFYLDEVFGQTGLYAVDNVWPVGPKIAPWGDFVKQGDLRQINGFEYITPR